MFGIKSSIIIMIICVQIQIRSTRSVDYDSDSNQLDISQELKNIIFRRNFYTAYNVTTIKTKITPETDPFTVQDVLIDPIQETFPPHIKISNNIDLDNKTTTISPYNEPIPVEESYSIKPLKRRRLTTTKEKKKPDIFNEHYKTDNYRRNKKYKNPSQNISINSHFHKDPDADIQSDTADVEPIIVSYDNNTLDHNSAMDNADEQSQNSHNDDILDAEKEPDEPNDNNEVQDDMSITTYADDKYITKDSGEMPTPPENPDDSPYQNESNDKTCLTKSDEIQQPIGNSMYFRYSDGSKYSPRRRRRMPYPHAFSEESLPRNSNEKENNPNVNYENTNYKNYQRPTSDTNESSYLHNTDEEIPAPNISEEGNKSNNNNMVTEDLTEPDGNNSDVDNIPVEHSDNNDDRTVSTNQNGEYFQNLQEDAPIPNIVNKDFRLAYINEEQKENENNNESRK